jgi:methyl-accepting chemotaxis protein
MERINAEWYNLIDCLVSFIIIKVNKKVLMIREGTVDMGFNLKASLKPLRIMGKSKNLVSKIGKENRRSEKQNAEPLDNAGKVRFFSTLRFRLIASFFIPIACIIILGLASFQKASTGIKDNYKVSTADSINMAAEYLRFGFQNVMATSNQYVSDTTLTRYLSNTGDILELSDTKTVYSKAISSRKTTDEFIGDIYIISDTAFSLSTRQLTFNGFYAGLIETEIGKYLKDNPMKTMWDGQDEYLDSKLQTDPSDYTMRIIRGFGRLDSVLIVDIKADTVNKILSDLTIDKSGILGVITPDGKEILATTASDPVFTGEAFYQEAITSEQANGTKEIEYKGAPYLFLYSKIGDTGAMICVLMPKATIDRQADSIKQITFIIVVIACILAFLTALLLSQGIDKTIQSINAGLKLTAKGDFTVQFNSKRKDEFHILTQEIQETFTNVNELIQQVQRSSSEVQLSSGELSKTSEQFLTSAENIANAMNEIEQGINQQAKNAEECLNQMDSLSHKIEQVSESTKEIGQIADNTKRRVLEGTATTDELNQQTSATIAITTDIIHEIEKLADKSSSINKIINVINDIANQTNLLSLNASIEAARAGEYGKGFAVVANEIRTLAEMSKSSVNDIKKIINSIQEDTEGVVEIARKAEKVLTLQDSAVKNTTDSYKDIHESVEKLVVFLTYITENVDNINEARISTLEAVESISAVLEEIAASSNNVNQVSSDQLTSVGYLNESVSKLGANAEHLVKAVQKFTI